MAVQRSEVVAVPRVSSRIKADTSGLDPEEEVDVL
jgi:hypothetical protein